MNIKNILKNLSKTHFSNAYDSLKLVLAGYKLSNGENYLWSISAFDDIILKKIIIREISKSKKSIGIDIGASQGEFSEIMIRASNKVEHIFIDARVEAIAFLNKKFQNQNAKILHLCLSDKKEMVNFNIAIDNPGYSGMRQTKAATDISKSKIISVQTCPLDEVPMNVEYKVSFIKIDVEGAELKVLNGAKNLILKNKPIIAFESTEYLNEYGSTANDIFDFFDKINYEINSSIGYINKLPSYQKKMFEFVHASKQVYFFYASPKVHI